MLLQLNRSCSPAPKRDLVDHLLDCHERIRRFSQLGVTLAARTDATAADLTDAAQRVHRYFTVALPLHVLDEDLSFEPRLAPFADAPVRAALDAMKAQHVSLDERLAVLVPRWERIAQDPAQIEDDRAELLAGSEALVTAFEEHLQLEENVLFPAARRHLDEETMSRIVGELQARRRPT